MSIFDPKLPTRLCKVCGNDETEHTIARPDEVLTLRSLGYEVYECDTVEADPLLDGCPYWVWVCIEKDGLVADCLEIGKVCKKADPENPCDDEFMKDISS